MLASACTVNVQVRVSSCVRVFGVSPALPRPFPLPLSLCVLWALGGEDTDRMCRTVSRVLVPGGKFVQISFAQPHFRKRYLYAFAETMEPGSVVAPYDWTVEHRSFGAGGCLENYLYICTKTQVSDEA